VTDYTYKAIGCVVVVGWYRFIRVIVGSVMDVKVMMVGRGRWFNLYGRQYRRQKYNH
jgi:hypothetical protein